ncbi:MAG: YlxR family protein [Deltaproteobacteria bacterium]|nr:YlxR family protein [Deltaproteobacteria bacterium]MBM4323343.1 YlxR family protein [Deltaproteobacteria bacterium]MBM4347377.1 YlxR family protein [Deltaproteobacteria bacterium]
MSRKGHGPIRQCIGCKKKKKKEEMIRFTLTADGRACMVGGRNQMGRGLYVCPDAFCIKMAKKRRPFGPLPDVISLEESCGKESIKT